MIIDWTTILTHLISFLLGASIGLFLNININIKKTKGNYSPIFANRGNVIKNDYGDKNEN